MPLEFAGYTELRRLGQGGSGLVTVARYDATGQLVAIKRLARALAGEAEFRIQFRDEARILGELRHPNIVALYGYLESDDDAAIFMELINGLSVADVLHRVGPQPPEAALALLSGALEGLEAAHRAGVVHRDVKPDNALLAGDGVSRLIDFGIAQRRGQVGIPAGTPMYIPPEQWAGAPASPQGDVYAAAVTLVECVAGRHPYDAGDLAELRAQHEHAELPLDLVPIAIQPLVARGMAKSPEERYESAGAFAAALEDAAIAGYGREWKERGALILAGAVGSLVALLPLTLLGGAAPVAGGVTTVTSTVSPGGVSAPASVQPPVGAAAGQGTPARVGLGAFRRLPRGLLALIAVVVVGALVGVLAVTGAPPFGGSHPAATVTFIPGLPSGIPSLPAGGQGGAATGSAHVRLVDFVFGDGQPTGVALRPQGGGPTTVVGFGAASGYLDLPLQEGSLALDVFAASGGAESSTQLGVVRFGLSPGDRLTVLLDTGGLSGVGWQLLAESSDPNAPEGYGTPPAVPAGKGLVVMDTTPAENTAVEAGASPVSAPWRNDVDWGAVGAGCLHAPQDVSSPSAPGEGPTISVENNVEAVPVDPGDLQWGVWVGDNQTCAGAPQIGPVPVHVGAGQQVDVIEYLDSLDGQPKLLVLPPTS